jgi:hypothetical protein
MLDGFGGTGSGVGNWVVSGAKAAIISFGNLLVDPINHTKQRYYF